MPTVTGTLEAVVDIKVEPGIVEVQLCGYGSQVPRFVGTALIARATTNSTDIPVGANGTFQFGVPGNDEIAPEGTYYTVTIKDVNGDTIQTNAYQFLAGPPSTGNYDLNNETPFDPNQPPPPLPPLITNQLLVMGAADDMVFPGNQYTAFSTILPGNVLVPTIQDMVPGNLYTFIIQQDGVGNHLFIWPPNVYNAALVSPVPWAMTIQTFVCDGAGNLYAIAGGTYWP